MSRCLFYLLALLITSGVRAQTHILNGALADSLDQPVVYATIALLDPADSSLQHYGVSDGTGAFNVKGVVNGSYLLQASAMGYKSFYKPIVVGAASNDNLGKLSMKDVTHLLGEVDVTAEKIPLLLKGDTLEYNAGSFKTRPDASVEELLKKLPGVQVDQAGNLKAQGEQVNKVLVDGKEFFGNDPKVATKNLPADAISKVQVFNKKSDQSVFTGIDDGRREKTINLELKEGKKVGYFGSLQAGAGTDDKYKLNGKLYRFRKESQFAVLGMLNNVNEFGFTMDDYLNFKGGMRGLMNGNGEVNITINGNDNLPVDFGQTVTGLITSGAGGFNYTWEPKENKRFNLSYLGNGSGKDLDQDITTRNFATATEFNKFDTIVEASDNWAHRLNFSGRNEIDSSIQLLLNGSAELTKTNLERQLHSSSFIGNIVLNSLESKVSNQGTGFEGGASASIIKKYKNKWPALKLSGNLDYTKSLTNTEWNNLLRFTDTLAPGLDWQYQDNHPQCTKYSCGGTITRTLGNGYYAEPEVYAGADVDRLKREQGHGALNDVVDSLSPDFKRSYQYTRPGISLRKSGKNEQLNISLRYEYGVMAVYQDKNAAGHSHYSYCLPAVSWRMQPARGRNLELSYNTSVQLPSSEQMLPVVSVNNPLERFKGNSLLAPEYRHQLNAHGLLFDEFTFTSLFVNLRGIYTKDKINWSRTINTDLSQEITLVNVGNDYRLEGMVEFSKPIRKLGVNVDISLGEKYNRGYNLVNDSINKTTVFNHNLNLKLSNRKKIKWDVAAGGSIDLTNTKYSLRRDLNNYFYSVGYFAELSFTPDTRWHFSCNADVNQYFSKSFASTVTVPLLRAEVSYSCLKHNRGFVILEAFDLLNSNTGLERISELNYLMEKRSGIINRYIMLTFRYRLNRAGPKSAGDTITIGK